MSNEADLDDEWGDFNEVSPTSQRGPSINGAVPELSSDTGSQHQKWNTSTIGALNSPNQSLDDPSNHSPPFSSTKSRNPPIPSSNSSTTPLPSSSSPSPTNIPPPSTLLHLIINILQTLPSELKTLLNPAPNPLPSPSPNTESPFSALHIHLSHLRASARILAGRKQRWKRDTHLAQNMSIAPSQPGRTGGMKLTGIDRAESRREDQDAAEVVRVWKTCVGGLRASFAELGRRYAKGELRDGNEKGKLGLVLPELSENMHVRVAGLAEGALKAPRQCALCGLRREERVMGVDGVVEDSFGEWWAEHWGHWDCWRFWGDFEGRLGQRR